MNPKRWPNLLSGARIALMPAVLVAAIAGSQRWFLILAGASLATDVLDGFLARRLNAFSDFGRKLDSAADYLTMITGLAGIAILWPEIVQRELPWIVAGLTAFCGLVVFGFVRMGHPPCYHTWAAKAGLAGGALSMIPLLTGWSAVPFHLAVILQIYSAVEEVIISLVIPKYVGEMATVWHALRMRERKASTDAKPPTEAPVHR
jgi:phosphatidylglycerophosphate synthase